MTPEQKADALEDFMVNQLDGEIASLEQDPQGRQQDAARAPRGTGGLFQPRRGEFKPMPAKPTLVDFFELRFAPANHVLQSAARAEDMNFPEDVVFACLLHDTVLSLMKPSHGDWGAQLYEPYVSPEVAFAIKYHAPLRFYPDPDVGYEYPEMYNRMFGEDYVPSAHTKATYEFARKHEWYMKARNVTMNDEYSFDRNKVVKLERFIDVIGRNFKQPEEGLGNDSGPSAHMWRTMADPTRPL
jgi:hypothetical protein